MPVRTAVVPAGQPAAQCSSASSAAVRSAECSRARIARRDGGRLRKRPRQRAASAQPSSQRPRPADTPSAHGRAASLRSLPRNVPDRPTDLDALLDLRMPRPQPYAQSCCRRCRRNHHIPLPSRWLLRADNPSVSGWPSPHREDVSEHQCSNTEQQAPSRAKGSSSIGSRLSTHPAAARRDSPSFRDRGRQLDCGADDCTWIHLAGASEQGMSTLLERYLLI
eukprot:COSAG01_NODE_5239_length_4384_cov_3.545200_1_plen_222_part_00